jgi:hypothetical protein
MTGLVNAYFEAIGRNARDRRNTLHADFPAPCQNATKRTSDYDNRSIGRTPSFEGVRAKFHPAEPVT